jgi:peptide/nickel transport system substrate-binding protein
VAGEKEEAMAKKQEKSDTGLMNVVVSRRQLLKSAAAGGMAAAGLLHGRGGEAGQAAKPAQAAAAATPALQPQKGGQIIVGISQEPQNFNPIMPTIESQRGVHMAIYDDLWRIDPKGNYIPNLATEIPTQSNGGISRDGTLFTVKLRKDAKWHDGQPFNAKDVVFTWQTLMNPKVSAFSTVGFDQIADMWVADEFTVKFKLKQAYAPILVALSAPVPSNSSSGSPPTTSPWRPIRPTTGQDPTLTA